MNPIARSRLSALALVAAVVVGAPPARAQETLGERLPVREVTLDNGMRLLILPRSGAPTVSFVMEFGIGGVHERPGRTGIAHLLEHMLFKGTTSIGTSDLDAERALFARMDAVHDTLLALRSAGDTAGLKARSEEIDSLEDLAREYVVANEFDRILTQAGARGLNAATTSESTMYFVELPANRIELWFALEADRMSNPVFREFYSERDVVIEERRMRVETSPGGVLYERHLEAAFTEHPYGQPVVGYMADLEALSRRDAESYYRRFYGPGNAVVAIVGSLDPDEVVRLAQHYLGRIPPGEEPPPVLAVEPVQTAERRVTVEWDAEPQLRIGWHVPSQLHADAPALTILSSILSGGRTSRLHRRLVLEDRIATGVYSSTGPGGRYPMLFEIAATPRSPYTPADLEAVIYAEIARLAEEGPTEEELVRVRNQVSAGAVRRVQANLGLAFQLAGSESLTGGWRETFRSTQVLREVTAEDVQRVARTYFDPTNRTVATLTRARRP